MTTLTCPAAAPEMTAATWRDHLLAAIRTKAAACGADVAGLRVESCVTDVTDGARWGLVFHGAAPDVCERAARFFAVWAARHLRDLGVVGGHGYQESIAYVGEMSFARGLGGTAGYGWHRGHVPAETVYYGCGEEEASDPNVLRRGYATAYAYQPGIHLD